MPTKDCSRRLIKQQNASHSHTTRKCIIFLYDPFDCLILTIVYRKNVMQPMIQIRTKYTHINNLQLPGAKLENHVKQAHTAANITIRLGCNLGKIPSNAWFMIVWLHLRKELVHAFSLQPCLRNYQLIAGRKAKHMEADIYRKNKNTHNLYQLVKHFNRTQLTALESWVVSVPTSAVELPVSAAWLWLVCAWLGGCESWISPRTTSVDLNPSYVTSGIQHH